MARMIYCAKSQKEVEGLDFPPYPGELGKRIYDHVSKESWNDWVLHQTRLVNEYRLNMMDPKSRKFLVEQMEKFLFGEDDQSMKEAV